MKGRIDKEQTRQEATLDLAALLTDDPSKDLAAKMAQRQAADAAYGDELWGACELLADIEPLSESEVVQSIISSPVKSHRKPIIAIAASVLVAVVLGMLNYQNNSFTIENVADRYVTKVGEQKEVVLSDGSTASLNTNSEMLVTMTAGERQITLKRGEAFFQVVKNAEAPFTVDANGHTITVLGTSFNVLKEPDLLRIEVSEGEVAVHKSNESVERTTPRAEITEGSSKTFDRYVQHRLSAGYAIEIDTGSHTSVLTAVSDDIGAWRSGFLSFSKVPLYLVVKELNRYSPKKILIEDRTLIDLPISATVKVDRINAMLRGLEASQGVKVKHFVDRIVLVEANQ